MKLKVVRSFASGNVIYDPGCVIDPSAMLGECFLQRGWCIRADDVDSASHLEVATAPEPEIPTRRKRGRPRKVPVEVSEVKPNGNY